MDARVNFAYGTVSVAPSPATSGTSMTVSGSWPATPFNAFVHAAGATEAQVSSGGEIVRVTTNAGGTFTITRASEGPNSARTIVIGDIVKAGVTKKTLDDIIAGGPFTGMTVNPAASTTDKGFNVTQTSHGTNPSAGGAYYPLNGILVSSDDADAGSDSGYAGIEVDWTFGGGAATGNRLGLFTYLKQTSATANAAGYYVALQGISESSSGDGGTDTSTGAKGSLFGENPQVRSNGATNLYQLCGIEADIFATGASTQKYATGIVACSYHINAGATMDAAFLTYAGGSFSGYGPGGGFGYGLCIAELESNGRPPIRSTGTLVGLSLTSLTSISVAKGIDFAKAVFSGNALSLGATTSQFTVGPTGLLGIGTAPSNGVDVKSSSAFLPQFVAWNDNNGSSGPYFLVRSTRAGGPTQVGDTLGTFIFQGYDSDNAVSNAAQMYAVAATVASGSVTAYLQMVQDLRITGSIGVTGERVVKGWFTDLEVTNAPTLSGVAIPSITSTSTLTNKRVTPRLGTVASSATPTINTDNVDVFTITALTVAITSMTSGLSGTPTDGQNLRIAVTGTASRAITWGTSFEASTVALPTTTSSTSRLDVLFVWNAATSKWRCVQVA